MADELLRLKVDFDGAKTVKEMEALRRSTTNFRKDQLIGSQQYTQAAKLEVDVKNKLHGLNTQAYSDNAKMKESYFNLGQALRQNRFAAIQMGDALGLSKGGLGAVIMALAGPGGWIAAGTAALTGLILYFKDTGEAAKKAAEDSAKAFEGMVGRVDAAYAKIGGAPGERRAGARAYSGSAATLRARANIFERFGMRGPEALLPEEAKAAGLSEGMLINPATSKPYTSVELIQEAKNLRIAATELTSAATALGVSVTATQAAALQSTGATLKLTKFRAPTFRPTGAIGEFDYQQDRIDSGYYDDPRRVGRLKDPSNQYAYNDEIGQFMRDKFPPKGKELKGELEKISPLAQNIGNSINLYIGGALDNVLSKAGLLGLIFSQVLGSLVSFGINAGLALLSKGGTLAAPGATPGGGTTLGMDWTHPLTAGGSGRRLPTVGTIRGGGGGGGTMEMVGVLRGRDIFISSRRASRSMGGSSL